MKTLSTHYIRLIGPIGLICLIGLIGGAKTAHALSLRNTSNNLGLVGYWNLNDGTSTKATDFSGNGNTGTLTNFALTGTTSNWVDGKKSKALAFDGSNDYVQIPYNSNLNLSSGLTLSAWVKPTNSTGKVIVAKPFAATHIAPYLDYGMYFKAGNIINFRIGASVYDNSTAINFGAWTHVVLTADGTNMRWYLNGVLDKTQADSALPTNTNSQGVRIGANADVGEAYDGSIDDVRIYNRALSATEIANMYNSGIAKVTGANDTGLVGYWPMDEGKGTVAGDSSGNRNSGTLTGGPTWVAGRRGKAVNFDGTDDYVTFSSTSTANLTGSLSVSTWFKATNTLSGAQTIVAKGGTYGQTSAMQYGMALDTLGGGEIMFWAKQTGGILTAHPVGALTNNIWYHVVGIYNGTTVFVYVNGVLAENYSDGRTESLIEQTDYSLNFGRNSVNNNTFFNGSIDDVRIYNRALSATEVANLYNAGATTASPTIKTVSDTGLVGYWNLDDGTSTKATDFSGNGNTGTLTNGPTWVTGKRGKAVSFDGGDDYVDSAYLQNAVTAYTIGVWVKTTETRTMRTFVQNRGGGGGQSLTLGIGTTGGGHGGAGTVGFEVDSDSTDIGISSTQAINDGAWHHVVGTWAATSGTAVAASQFKIYIDGVEASVTTSSTGSATSPLTGLGGTKIAFHNAWNTYFSGSIDEVRIYNRVLTATEVQTLYNMGR